MVQIVTFSAPLPQYYHFPPVCGSRIFFLVVDLVGLKLERNIHVTKVVIHKINLLQTGVTHVRLLC